MIGATNKIAGLMFLAMLWSGVVYGQNAQIKGFVLSEGKPVSEAMVQLLPTPMWDVTDGDGQFEFLELEEGTYSLVVMHEGYHADTVVVHAESGETHEVRVHLKVVENELDAFVVTGTRTLKSAKATQVVVGKIEAQMMESVQACNLSEGLQFQPGLRVETNCQTCNYTQLRMNGLPGGYSQILINGRPIFSPITGLYGLEQLPTNMIDRVEVVRGGGSSLYGSSAVGGTVNLITRLPKANGFSIEGFGQVVGERFNDRNLRGSMSLVHEKTAGMSLFFNLRNREAYDHNGDGYSELPELKGASVGGMFFYKLSENQKLEVSFSHMTEYRYGGEMFLTEPAHFAEQAEERDHKVWMASLDYQVNFNRGKSSFIAYAGNQRTLREHYTGLLPEGEEELSQHWAAPPYGNSLAQTLNAGFQLNHECPTKRSKRHVFTVGSEWVYDDVYDEIVSYGYLWDQSTMNFGVFAQSDWKLTSRLSVLSGLRWDHHSMVERPVLNPRVALLMHFLKSEWRLSYGTGFRAPQAFDSDMHIAFAGGGVSRVSLSEDLAPEFSESWSASMTRDVVKADIIFGWTLESFYTKLENAFALEIVGEDDLGLLFEKRNSLEAQVFGATAEFRLNYNKRFQLESGMTFQKSSFRAPIQYIDGIPGEKSFIRTPNWHGYSVMTVNLAKKWKTVLNYRYTGSMILPHFSGAPNQTQDVMVATKGFHELNLRLSKGVELKKSGLILESFAGVKNALNQYQNDFDIGPNRDSNYIYGPALPRTIYFGVKLGSK